MSADTTPVILITDGEDGGKEYRPAIVQGFRNVWIDTGDDPTLNSRYVIYWFGEAVVVSSLEDAQQLLDQLSREWKAQCLSVEYDQETLDLSGTTFDQLREQVKIWDLHGFDLIGVV